MIEKQKPIGICDLCGSQMPIKDWYTKHGPRVYCSHECRQTGNSRNGAAIRSVKAKKRVRDGKWKNPKPPITPQRKKLLAQYSRDARLHEVGHGQWRNPALSEEARKKLSRPRKHDGVLHTAIEKLRFGTMADLTNDERSAYLAYRKNLRDKKRRNNE